MSDLAKTRVSNAYIWRRNFFSVRLDPRTIWASLALLIAVLIVAIWSISAGDFPMSIADIFASFLGEGQKSHDFVIFKLRLPRLLTGLAVGAAFGMSGAIFQSLARNPLASPDIIGFNSGAALGAVIMIISFGATGFMVAVGAVTGGLLTAILVFVLSWKGGLNPYRLVLVGIGIGFTVYAGVSFLMTRTDIFYAAAAQHWLTGTLNARIWRDVYMTWLGFGLLAPLALGLQMSLNRLEMGDDMARALGIRINIVRSLMALIGVLMVSMAVAGAGPIGFVSLVAGPIARRLTLSSGACLGGAALVGALVLIGADLMGRVAFAAQLPAGVFTAVIGAPFLLWLLATQIRKGAM
ncbi:MAG: hypothetical protein COB24_06345 [Hyphomicrobiales bacterium]|nr:MAG: hypothetical protein COB24_06345 [Hyphomicrobiales bacterium]